MGDCCSSCCRCLAGIPCRTLAAIVMLFVGLGAYAGGAVIGTQRLEELIDQAQIDNFHYILMGVCIGSAFFGIIFFIIGALSTGWTARHVFNTTKKNACARIANIFCNIFAFVLLLGWSGIACVTMTPVVFLTLVIILKDQGNIKCIDLKNYGFEQGKYCDADFDDFAEKSTAVLICFGVSVLAAIIVIVALSFFIACISADYAHLEETKYVTYNTYKSEDKNSQESMLDTKM